MLSVIVRVLFDVVVIGVIAYVCVTEEVWNGFKSRDE